MLWVLDAVVEISLAIAFKQQQREGVEKVI